MRRAAHYDIPLQTKASLAQSTASTKLTPLSHRLPSDILVIGSLASDTSCDYSPFEPSVTKSAPILHTSNPAIISGSAGGVGRNVATAAQYAGAQVSLASALADDLTGKTLLEDLTSTGIDTSNMRILDPTTGARTAQYIAVNDSNKDLVVAMGDFSIFSQPEFEQLTYWSDLIESQGAKPRWIVLDGNWSTTVATRILKAAKSSKIPVAFEPVSTVKAARLFHTTNTAMSGASVLPDNLVSLATPNKLELAAMHSAAQASELFASEAWWTIIDAFGLSSAGSRDKFVSMLGLDLANVGVPQQIIQLLPYIPNIITKLGPQGSLLTMVLRKDDPRLTHPDSAPYILSRSSYESGDVGGLYMRLFPPAEVVRQEDVVSVNGVGDTLLGVVMAGLVADLKNGRQPRLEDILPVAQRASVLTLKSKQSVSSKIKELSWSIL